MTNETPLTMVHPPCGPTRGKRVGDVLRFTGIPFAKASRFQPPRAADDWTNELDATGPSSVCPQPVEPNYKLFIPKHPVEGLTQDEDCLYLAVTTPLDAAESTEKLSVIVWIHGGGFCFGAGDAAAYDPSKLVGENRVIVVNVNYRLGLFGFLGNGTSRPGNLGLLDQLAALRWVRRNISAFGGDKSPSSTTLMGHSAGASSIVDILSTQGVEALFGRAIIQSPPLGISRGRYQMDQALNKEVENVTIDSTVEEVLQGTQRVINAGKKYGIPGGMPFAPQYGTTPLPNEDELDTALDTTAPHIAVLIGGTTSETSIFINFMPWIEWASNLPFVGSLIHHAFVSVTSAYLYHNAIDAFASRYAKAGGSVSRYRISWSNTTNRMGATHSIELPLLLGSEDAWAGAGMLDGFNWDRVERDGEKLRRLWAEFAKGRQVGEEDGVEGVIDVKCLNVR